MTAIDPFLLLVDRYCAALDCAEATLATRMLGDGKRLAVIRAGGDIGARRLQRAILWLSENWPAEVTWPDGIVRPTPAKASTLAVHSAPEPVP